MALKSSGKMVELPVDNTCEQLELLGIRDDLFSQINGQNIDNIGISVASTTSDNQNDRLSLI